MGDKSPRTIFTDQDEAMKNAIKSVFPNSVHRLSTWHISKNAAENIQHLYAKPNFKSNFNYILKCCEIDIEFESKWKEPMENFEVSDNKWLKRLYALRDKWSPAFNRDVFSANIRSTQRSESTNNVFQQNSGKKFTLIEFVHRYDDTVNRMREIEKEDDYKCFHRKPLLSVWGNSLFKHAAEVYTHKIFKMFEDEFLQCMSYKFVEQGQEGIFKKFKVIRRGGSREHTVHFNPLNLIIICSCKKFESMGLLCRHALCILNFLTETDKIPDIYVLKRWTKNAKRITCRVSQSLQSQIPDKSSKLRNLNELMHRAFSVMNLSSENGDKVAIAHKYLDQIESEVLGMNTKTTENINNANEATESREEDTMVLDPLKKWSKGISYGRQKGHLEKRKRKKPNKATAISSNLQSTIVEVSSLLPPTEFSHSIVPVPSVLPANQIPIIENEVYYYPSFQSMLMNVHRSNPSAFNLGEVESRVAGNNINADYARHHQDR